MKKIGFVFLIFLHNLIFSLLIVFSSYNQSFLASILALTYWIIGWLIIFRKRKLAEMSETDHKRPSSD